MLIAVAELLIKVMVVILILKHLWVSGILVAGLLAWVALGLVDEGARSAKTGPRRIK